MNYSTPLDLVKLSVYIAEHYPIIFEISTVQKHVSTNTVGSFNHLTVSTNELLADASVPLSIIGGKTGETPQSGKNLVLITKAPEEKGFLVNIVLGSEDNFGDMKTMLDWVTRSFNWNYDY